ncbi:MAG TPA: hypothetical protein VKV02_01270 [Acidobacteriaceae bacterium]|nr:hypothetical protein [Acidobacteriaceae bacterium]
MTLKTAARHTAMLSNLLIAASLFFALVWWWVCVSLFVAGWVAFGLARLMDGSFVPAPSIVQSRG